MKNFKSDQPCVVCGECRDEYVTFHHVLSQKAHPELRYEKFNLMPLCQRHHVNVHAMGANKFAQKYKEAAAWFKSNGWDFRLNGKIYYSKEEI